MASGSSNTAAADITTNFNEIDMISEEGPEAELGVTENLSSDSVASGSSNTAAADITTYFHVIDMISEEGPEVELGVTEECCIYKVPESLRNSNPEAYTPQLISIGPIHRDVDKLKPMENQKRLYLRFFWKRLKNDCVCRWKFSEFIGFLGKKEDEIRGCYSQKYPELSKLKFVEMILLDAVFIMELFLRKSDQPEPNNDYMFKKAWLQNRVELDLLLLENQLPVFVLKELYNMVVLQAMKKPKHRDFLNLACEYFSYYDPQRFSEQKIELRTLTGSCHFTELIRYFFIPCDLSYDCGPSAVIKSATKLRKAGISFEPVKNKCLLDVKFKKSFLNFCLCFGCIPINCVKARFQFPVLDVQDSTECVVRNIMAFEQCHHPNHTYICRYFAMIDDLIRSKEDVELLVEKEVIVHRLSSDEEVANLVNKLCTNIVLTSASSCYGNITKELNEHYYNKWYRVMSKLRFQYFGDLLRATATVVALLVLFFNSYNFYHNIHKS